MHSYDQIQHIADNLTTQDWKLLTKHIENPSKFKIPQRAIGLLELVQEVYPKIESKIAFALIRQKRRFYPTCDCGIQFKFSQSTYTFRNVCEKCSPKEKRNAERKPILVDGRRFSSIKEASTSLSLSRDQIRYNLLNPSKTTWTFQIDHDKTCIDMIQSIHPSLTDKQLVESWKRDRIPMQDILKNFDIKCHSTLKLVYAFHGLDTKFQQIDTRTKMFLDDRERFVSEFSESNSEELATRYNCSPSCILQTAEKYGIDRTERHQSAIERHLISWLAEIAPELEVISRDRTAIGVELDIYIPSKKLAIELDGLYWHTDRSSNETRNVHQEKHQMCYRHGITLLRFTDVGETVDKLDIVKSMIRSRIGKTKKLFARKCDIVELSSRDSGKFFDANHISGKAGAKVHLGLVFDGALVMGMSFGKPRFSKEAKWEIIRMATVLDHTVIGGASKLLNYFRSNHEGSILSYANLRLGTGKIYEKLGFVRLRKTSPGYFYTDLKRNYSRFQFQKHNIQKMCPNYDSNLTEAENAYSNGFRKYQDCGNLLYKID